MKVRVAVPGRFHGFDLGRELQSRGLLGGLLTTYPRSQTRRFGLADQHVQTRVREEVWRRIRARLPLRFQSDDAIVRAHARFDRATERWLKDDAELFVGWSGSSLASLARARQLGLASVLERGSTHISWACATLERLGERHGLSVRVAPSGIVERELQEYERADRIAVPSQFVARTFIDQGVPAGKLLHLPYGVDVDRFRAPPGRIADGVFRVLFVGAVGARKGVLELLAATARLGSGAELVLVGRVEPQLREHLARCSSNVRVLGSVPQAQLRAHYARADVFCLPSHEEGLAMVLAQAMAAGRAVVASHASGADDLIEHDEHGLLVEAGDVEGLLEHFVRLREAPELREELGRRAAARIERGFRWADYGERVQAAYAQLL